jgi:hypothetical protein
LKPQIGVRSPTPGPTIYARRDFVIKNCWKCKERIDTQAIDVEETVGLCRKCFERFDEEPKPSLSLPENPSLTAEVVTNHEGMVAGGPTGPEVFIQRIEGLPIGTPPMGLYIEVGPGLDPAPDLEYIKARMFEVLKVPAEYIQPPPKPNVAPMADALMLLQDLISAEVKRIENSIGNQPEVDRIKTELRAASIKILKEVAPEGVLLSHIERVVDSALAEAFKDIEPAPVMGGVGVSPG